MITTVLIDIDDTLLDFKLCAKWSMLEAAKRMKLELPEDTFACFEKINSMLWKSMERKEITYDGIYGVRWNLVAYEIGIVFDGDEFERHFLDCLAQSTIPVDGALEVLAYLSTKYNIYAASNGPYMQQLSRMSLAGMDKYLSGYFISEKMGCSKPTKEFFDICFKETGVDSLEELIMIGDSLSADINGAKDYGIKTCWFNKDGKNGAAKSDYTVCKLVDIKKFL